MPYDLDILAGYEPQRPAAEIERFQIELDLDVNLIEAWTYTRRFCSTINHVAEHKHQLPKEALLNSMASVMYRLLHMRSFNPASINEALRLGLLVFSSHIFLNWQDVKPRHTQLPHIYRSCLFNFKMPSTMPPQILLWLLIIGSISTFTSEDDTWLIPWVRVNVELCEVRSWSELRIGLKACPWIDFLHNQLGSCVLDKALSPQ